MKQTINQILLQGLDAQKKGKLYEAEQFYNHILKVHPNHPEANHNLGFIKINNNDLGAAYILFKKAIEANPKIEQFWVSYSNLLIKQKKFKEAENNYKIAMTTIPNSPVIHNNLGGILYTLRRMEESIKNYKKAIELKPDYVQAYNNLGAVLYELGELEDSETKYKKTLELKSDYAEAHSNLAAVMSEQGKFELALESCKKAITLNPNLYQTYCTQGNIQKEMTKLKEAKNSFQKAIELKPDYKEALIGRGQILFDEGEFELSLKDFDTCNSEDSRARALAALYGLGRIDEIYQRIKKNSKLDAENLKISSFSSFIISKEKKDTGHDFCKNPLDFLYNSNISSHLKDSNFFINEIILELRKNVKLRWEAFGKTTRKGFHSGGKIDLFKNPPENICKLQSIILDELELYYSKFKDQSCSYIKKWPLEKKIKGWHVILKKQGYQVPHMHASGWLSGIIYLKVVPSLKKNEGAIEFSLNGDYFFDTNSPKIIFEPKIGDIVFFPSSLHHRTIPFSTDSDRMVIAFDLAPNKS